MTATLTEQPMISASEMARRANVPIMRLLKCVKADILKPNATVLDGRLHLFSTDRIDEVKETLAADCLKNAA